MTQAPTLTMQSSALFRNSLEFNYLANTLRSRALGSCTVEVSRIYPMLFGFQLKKVSACAMLTLPLSLKSSTLVLLPVIGEEMDSPSEPGEEDSTTANRMLIETYLTNFSTISSREAQRIKQSNQSLIGMAVKEIAFIYWQRFMTRLTSRPQMILPPGRIWIG